MKKAILKGKTLFKNRSEGEHILFIELAIPALVLANVLIFLMSVLLVNLH